MAGNPSARLIKRLVDVRDDVAEELGPFIAGPRPSNPVLGAYHDYTRWVCDSYAQVPGWARAVPGTGVAQAAIDASIGQTCAPYLGSGAPRVVPPFTGGQCPVSYRVQCSATITFNDGSTLNSTTGVYILRGPITGFGTAPGGAACGGSTKPAGAVFHNGGTTVVACPGPAASITITGFVLLERVDGQPDNCGNPRPKLPTPSPTRPPDPGPNPPGGGQPPVFGPRGTPIFRPGPIRSPYDEPDIPFPPFDPYYPDDGGEDDPYYGPDNPPPGDPGDPGVPSPTGDGGEGEGDAPEGSELVGLKINLTKIPLSAKEYAPGVYRGACYIYMGNDAGLDQDFAGSMIADGQFVLAEKGGLTRWRVVANPGYDVLVTPYYREVE